ncbi:MAG: fluoride efflux transporter CrcB [Firmicutes bacterium]|nr:fluoride efflux transporter CrcB [Bacillota bacterium]
MNKLAAVALGGMVGASLRYLVGAWAERTLGTAFPWGTAIVNITGCLFIGFLMTLIMKIAPLSTELCLFLVTGTLGSLTTFSTFSYETLRLIQQGSVLAGFANVAVNLLLGLAAVLVGSGAAHLLN